MPLFVHTFKQKNQPKNLLFAMTVFQLVAKASDNIIINILGMNRQSWSFEQDEAISKLVKEFGFNDWTKIAQKLQEQCSMCKRTGKQCRQRWYNHLNPSVSKKPWSGQEEETLFELHKVHGNRWKDISRYFFGRTDNDIKNHFYSTLRRSLRRLNKILGEKNATSQMREIKPSVLSNIMNYLYDGQSEEGQFYRSIKDLPSLIFQFANFKPIKNNLKPTKLQEARDKISDIFELINRFNQEYEQNKLQRNTLKQLKKNKSKVDNEINITNTCKSQVKIQYNPTIGIDQVSNGKISESTIPQSPKLFKMEPEHLLKNQHFSLQENEVEGQSDEVYQEIAHLRQRNMSLDQEELQAMQMQQLQQPSRVSGGDCLDLVIVGQHWQPQSWQRQNQAKQFVDEVLQMNYSKKEQF